MAREGWPSYYLRSPQSRTGTIPRELPLPSVLSKIAQFHFHLGRQKPPATKELESVLVSENVGLRMYRMTDGSDGLKPNMIDILKDNTARLDTTDAAWYGIEIFNKSLRGLFAYLFCFDPSEYSITVSPCGNG